MIIRTYKPDGALAEFVDYFWYLESQQASPSNELSLPDGSVDLIIDLVEDKVPMTSAASDPLLLDPVFLCGPHSRPFVICNLTVTRVIGVHFKPGGAFPFVRFPLDELHNHLLSMNEIWGSLAGELREELLEQKTVRQMFHALERRLPRLAMKPIERHPALPYALDWIDRSQAHPELVRQLVDEIGISHRHFIELFRREIGYTPKGYSRIRRFQEVLKELSERDKEADWADLAASCGYYDQSHFIKDFRAFTGFSPGRYEAIAGRNHNHVVV